MTDITDQDRRAAMAWAKNWQGDLDNDTSAAARVILATVDAPAPPLAEELARIAKNSPVWTIQNVRDELKSAAAHAEQMDHDLAEARAEVKVLSEELAGAESEVERLAAERDRIANGRNITFTEMDGKPLPDPDEVPDGEAWLVEVNGERRAGIRSKNSADYDGAGWSTSPAPTNEWWVEDDRITLITRLVPAPRVITNPDELDKLAERNIVRDQRDGEALQKISGKWIVAWTAHNEGYSSGGITPVTVLWEQEA